MLITVFLKACCCISGPCQRKYLWWRRRVHSYKKFKIAEKRLVGEIDVQKIVAMNRINKLVQKLLFTARQRKTVSFSRRYVLTEKDIDSAEETNNNNRVVREPNLEVLWRDLDPEGDAWDRRLLYEVTGIADYGFRDRNEDTSDEDRQAP